MAWTCTLYTGFSKKINSTKQPSGGTNYDCRIKNDTDFKNPILEIKADDLSGVNYMKFNGEYFYVTSLIPHRTGVWDVAGARDPMATYKGAIGATSAYLLYANGGTDVSDATHRVPDERLAIYRTPEKESTLSSFGGTGFTVDTASGTFLLSAVGENGGVCSYALSLSSMANLISGLNVDRLAHFAVDWNINTPPATIEAALTDIRNGLWQTLTNMLSYGSYTESIKACYWVPFSGFSGSSGTVYLGDYNTGVSGVKVGSGNKVVTNFDTISIPWPVDDWKRNNCVIQLYVPFVGILAIPVDKVINDSSITVYSALDMIGGNISIYVFSESEHIFMGGSNAAAPYAIGSSNVTPQNFMNGVLSMIGGGVNAGSGIVQAIMTSGVFGIGEAAGGVTSMAQGLVQAITPTVQCAGSIGGISSAAFASQIRLTLLYYPPIDEAATRGKFGYPVMAVNTPKGGYNCFRAFSVDCGGTPDEMERINAFFNSGAFYE